jgi:YD repeat-containing protein
MIRSTHSYLTALTLGWIIFGSSFALAQTTIQSSNSSVHDRSSSSTPWYSQVANQNGNRTTFRDSSGRVQGTSSRSGNKTTFRDRSGRVVGTASTSGGTASPTRIQTTFRDSSGRLIGSSTTNGRQTTSRDRSGRMIGSATRSTR